MKRKEIKAKPCGASKVMHPDGTVTQGIHSYKTKIESMTDQMFELSLHRWMLYINKLSTIKLKRK